jgi:DNA processing protein
LTTTLTSSVAERRARMGLASLALPHDLHIAASLRACGAVETWANLLHSNATSLAARRARLVDLEDLVSQSELTGARFIIPGDEEWPPQLNDLQDHEVDDQRNVPYGVWAKGESLLALMEPVAILGARASTAYGNLVAGQLSQDLASEGHTIVSSLAYGIDSSALQGALAVGGSTVAISAAGIGETRLSGHDPMVGRLGVEGTIVSETPPGSVPSRAAFISRHRLIAALARGTVVVEASNRSGTRATATWTIELGRVLMAVPGPITSALSSLPHELIRRGQARLVTSAQDVRHELLHLTTEPIERLSHV